ncbi:nardilysin-like [Neodiprion virginianus]|uniref:nardilysin-like n=1 Tax=Neodiprion virginianus TaxID=2961670 RepID=UPI001EE6A6FF|nr:nardilysin-like [Neodiprion virginianus]
MVVSSKISLFKILNRCINKTIFVSQIMPKRLSHKQSNSPKKKFRLNYDSVNMPKPVCITEDPNPLQADKPQNKPHPVESLNMAELEKCIQKNSTTCEYLDTPVKSENDKKDYRVIKLPNGLTALLISDVRSISADQVDDDDDDDDYTDEEESGSEESGSESDEEEEDNDAASDVSDGDIDSHGNKRPRREEKMAACGLCVGVGSFSDPSEIPGMAHFLEHMVFMGSEKYPQENDFSSFVSKHGGSDNASTGYEETTFYFEIQEKQLFSALDRFAQFFISPLMKRDAITREREAIESEFQMALPSDFYRKEQLFCSLAQPGHPASKFAWGNLITLRDNVVDDKLYEELHKFRERHYSAHRMTLALQARLPLDTLEQYVKDCFSTVPNNNLPPEDFSRFKGTQSFETPDFKRIYKIKPVKDVCQVELTWALPSLHHLYKSKPHQYVSWIIGHEGKGSLISYLRKKMWCLDIFSGNGESAFEHTSLYALFSLSLVLTEDGHKHLKEVLDAVFSYIKLMCKSGPQKRIYDEIHQTEENSFRFTDEISAVDYVENLSESMRLYASTDYITGSDLYFEYNPEGIKACMDALTPDNVNIVLFDKKFNDSDFDKVEPWFNTKYTDTEIPNDWIEHWKTIEPLPEFHLPEPNIFLTDDFTLVPLPEDVPKYPTKIHSDPMSEVWFRPDPKFKIPECYMYYYFISPLALTSPENAALMDLLVTILKQLLVEELYPANAAELNYLIYTGDKGIIVKVNGFNQKLPLLLATITKYIADCPNLATQSMFDVMKAEQLKVYYNTFLKPGKLVKDVRLSILMLVHWAAVDRHAAVSGIEFQQFQTFAKEFTRNIYIQCLVQGNITDEDVINHTRNCLEILQCQSLSPDTMPQLRVAQIPLGVRCCRVKNFNTTDTNSVVTNYYQSGIGSTKISVIIELLIMLMEEPLFNQLRTQEQLGYNVFCLMRDTFGILGYSITVCTQADKFTTEHVDERIETFIKSFLKVLNKMSEKELNNIKVALVKLKQCVDLHLKEEVNRNWAEITSRDYMFDRQDKEISAVNSTKIVELRKWMENHVLGGNNLRKLSVQVVGNPREKKEIENESGEQIEVVRNAEENKRMNGTSKNGIAKSRDSFVENKSDSKFPLEFLTNLTNDKTIKPPEYYITDIVGYKKNLHVYPANCNAK